MIDSLIRFSIYNKLIVALFVAILAGWGIYSASQLPIDAVPDITNNQVQVVTVSPALAPQEVEKFITYPVEIAMANLPGVLELRSLSRFGLSVVTIIFKESVPTLESRQLVGEKLAILQGELDARLGLPYMMPITTGLGEIYQYTLEVEPGYESKYDAMELRSLQDWLVKRRMAGLPGVVDVSSFGGYLKQYEVAIDPESLRSFNLSVEEVFTAVAASNQNAGGSYIEKGPNAFYIRSEGLLQSPDELREVVVAFREGMPIRLEQLAQIGLGHAIRYGAMTKDGKGEAVGGIVLMLKGANASETMKAVHARVEEIQESLPEGVKLVPFLDRSELVGKVIGTVSTNLIEGGLIVIFILILLMGNLRAGLVVASVIPLSMLFALSMMRLFGVSANLMSLGAIDFGLIVDGAVIIVESIVHRLHLRHSDHRLSRAEMDGMVYKAASRIRSSAAFGEIIILIVYLPILALVGVEGKMFKPMALTVSFAILGALILSLTYVPMMSALVLSRKRQDQPNISDRIMEVFQRVYAPLNRLSLRYPRRLVGMALVLFMSSLWLFGRLGAEFIPNLEEGDLAMQMTIPPGSSLEESRRMSTEAEALLLEHFPEVRAVVSKIGTAEIPTDPMGVEDADIMILLQPKKDWVSADDRDALAEAMKEVLEVMPGVSFEFTQPIQLRFNELLTGVKSDIAVQLFGEDLSVLAEKAEQVAALVSQVEGASDVLVQATEGLPQLMVRWDRKKMASYGLSIVQLNTQLQTAYAGGMAGIIYEGDARYDLVVRLRSDLRHQTEYLGRLPVRTADGALIPLEAVADISIEDGPLLISRENTKRYVNVLVNVRKRDMQSVVEDIERLLQADLSLPAGYFYRFGGQYQNLQAARDRLALAVPLALLLIFILLYFTFKSWVQALLIFTAIPMSAMGGILALWLRDMPFSISAGVGFIALFGVAVLNGIVLIAQFNQLKAEGTTDVEERIREGTRIRLRPVLMTAAVASLGFLPMALSSTAGGEVQRPLATVVIGGLLTATLLTLVVLPALYLLIERGFFRRKAGQVISVLLLLMLVMPNQLHAQSRMSMDDAVSMALQRHPEIRQAKLQLSAVEARVKQAWDLGETQFGLERGQINYLLVDRNFTIFQPLGMPLHMAATHKYRRMEVELEKNRLAELQNRVVRELREAWLQVAWLQAREQLLAEQLSHYARFDTMVQRRYEQGSINMLARALAENRYDNLQWQRTQLQTEYEAALRNLAALLQLQQLPELSPWPGRQTGLNLSSGSRNPALRMLMSNEALMVQQQKQATAGFSPSLGLGYFNQSLEQIPGFQGVQLSVGIPLAYFGRQANWQSAKLNRETARVALEAGELRLNYQMEQAIRELHILEGRLDYFDQTAMPRAEQILQTANRLFDLGEIEYFEYLQSLDAVLNIRLDKLQHELNYQLAANRLAEIKNTYGF
ncbi:MAG: CusA/CzcA family heavy metal efflux RND transporter [Bacteroidia bacterium]